MLSTKNSTEDIKYSVQFNDLSKEKPDNLKFKIREMPHYCETLQDLEENLEGIIKAKSEKEIRIDWEWPYESGKSVNQVIQNNKLDTVQGKKFEMYKFEIIVKGEEVT